MEIESTTIFNEVLEALDTGKTIYVFNSEENYGSSPPAYKSVIAFSCIFDIEDSPNGIPLIALVILSFGGQLFLTLNIMPSNDYVASDLYNPNNIEFSEYQPQM